MYELDTFGTWHWATACKPWESQDGSGKPGCTFRRAITELLAALAAHEVGRLADHRGRASNC